MNTKRQIALNKFFNFCMVLGAFSVWLAIEFWLEHEIAWGIGMGVVALLFLILPAIFTPFCYVFDSDGVSLRYLFLPTERYLWKDIYAIEVEDISGSRSSLFDVFYASVFSLKGHNVGKRRFYMEGHIRKSFRTKRLLETYWDGTITGYLFEDTKKWLAKRKAKKQTEIQAHLTDEVALLERESRASARDWLAPFVAQAKQCDLDIHTNYRYITNDFKEQRSRPNEGYTYTLVANIAHPNETDDDRIVCVSVDLLYVRLGKQAYRGTRNEHAEEELRLTLSDVLDEIAQHGIAVYSSKK